MTLIVDSPYEGAAGEKMIAMQTRDNGKTWSDPVDIDTEYDLQTSHQASAYGSVVARPDGSRVFALWVQNINNVENLPGEDPNPLFRADMLGNFLWKYSDDQGSTWSDDRYTIPVPFTYIESVNSFSEAHGGTGNETKTQIMWEVDTVKTMSNGTVLFAFTKIGTYAVAPPEEMYIMASHNLLVEEDPEKVEWVMWPEGWHGPGAVNHLDDEADDAVAEESHVVPINNETQLYMTFRQAYGYMGQAYSQVGNFGADWGESSFAEYMPTWAGSVEGGDWVKQCRGPMTPVRQKNNLILMIYYNTEMLAAFASTAPVSDRNLLWLTVGLEDSDGLVKWSQPELTLYDRDRAKWHGYCDVITTNDGHVYISETYKGPPESEARTHKVSDELLEKLYGQMDNKDVTSGVTASFDNSRGDLDYLQIPSDTEAFNFRLYPREKYGFTFDLRLPGGDREELVVKMGDENRDDDSGVTILDSTDANDHGVKLERFFNGTVKITLTDADGMTASHMTDPTCSAQLAVRADWHQLAVIVDGGPKLIMLMVDGKLCDGGRIDRAIYPDDWKNGHSFFNPLLGDTSGKNKFKIGDVLRGRFYDRVLFTSELIGNFRSDH